LQVAVAPADLTLFERYWMRQFAGLLNAAGAAPCTAADSPVAHTVRQSLRSILLIARISD